jgi:hypothetical protein
MSRRQRTKEPISSRVRFVVLTLPPETCTEKTVNMAFAVHNASVRSTPYFVRQKTLRNGGTLDERFEEIMTDEELIVSLDETANWLIDHDAFASAIIVQQARNRIRLLTEVKATAEGSVEVKVAVCVDQNGQGAAVVRTGFASDFDAMRRAREGTMAAKAECIAIVHVPRIHIPAVTSTIEEPK